MLRAHLSFIKEILIFEIRFLSLSAFSFRPISFIVKILFLDRFFASTFLSNVVD